MPEEITVFTLLFVCTGNTCRSAMAQAITQDLLNKLGIGHRLRVLSAGTSAWPGSPASSQARNVMYAQGLSLEEHGATTISESLLQEADLILTMTRGHRDRLLQIAPDQEAKIFTLKEYVGDFGDIADPFGMDERVYSSCALEIKTAVQKALARIQSENH